MPKLPVKKDLLMKKKRRFLSEMINPGEIKSEKAWLSIHGSSKDLLSTYESSGLVVSLNGSGSLRDDHPVCEQARQLSAYIREQGGIIMDGGRSTGIMKASYEMAGDKCLGVIFPELKKESNNKKTLVMVNSPQPRIEILATCAPVIVVFRGGLGTLNVLLRAMVHTRNRVYHPSQPPQLLFISNYWIGLLHILLNLGCLPREFLTEMNFFDQVDDIINKINKVIK